MFLVHPTLTNAEVKQTCDVVVATLQRAQKD